MCPTLGVWKGESLRRVWRSSVVALLVTLVCTLTACDSNDQEASQQSPASVATAASPAQIDAGLSDEQRRRVDDILAVQIAMNRQTYAMLQESGLQDDTVVRLDFTFVAPDRSTATALKSFLDKNDCVTVEVVPGSAGEFEVTGQSLPTTLTLDLLDQWVSWMVEQGVARDCEFDGWGALVPE